MTTQLDMFGSSVTVIPGTGAPIALGLGLSECCGEVQSFSVTYGYRWNDQTATQDKYVRAVETYCTYCERECDSCPNILGAERDYMECENCGSCGDCCDCYYCDSGEHFVSDICENTSDGAHCERHCNCHTCNNCGNRSESYYCDNCGTCSCGDCDDDNDYAADLSEEEISVPFTYVSLGESFATDGRAFGVELEITRLTERTALNILRAAGLSAESYGGTDVWAVVDDSSVSNGCEVRSPILRGADGFLQLRVAMSALLANGAEVDESCGTHVHHDMTDRNGKELAAVCRAYRLNQSVIDSFALRSASESNGYAKQNDEDTERQLESAKDDYAVRDACYYADRYKAVNVRAFPQHSTLEFRQHAGTLDYSQLRAWILFGQSIVTGALRGMLNASANSADVLLRNLERYGLPTDAREQLTETSRKTLLLNRGYVR